MFAIEIRIQLDSHEISCIDIVNLGKVWRIASLITLYVCILCTAM